MACVQKMLGHIQVQIRGHLFLLRRFFLDQTPSLTVAVGPFHVMLHVALLGEPDAADLTLERLLPRVFDHVDVQGALLIEGLVALAALERALTGVGEVVSLQLASLGKGFAAAGAAEDSRLLGAGRGAGLMHALVILQVRGPFESLVADAADVAAVLPVRQPTVPPQHVGVLEGLITVVALIPGVGFRVVALPALMVAICHAVTIIGRSIRGLGMMADQYDLLVGAAGLSWKTGITEYRRERLTLRVEVEGDTVQHPLGVSKGQRDAAVPGYASWRHHQALRGSGVRQGCAGLQAADCHPCVGRTVR